MTTLTTLQGGPVEKEDSSSDEEDDIQQKNLKIVVIGDGAVGKTSLIQKFCNNNFSTSYKQTIGIDFCTRRMSLVSNAKSNINNKNVTGINSNTENFSNCINSTKSTNSLSMSNNNNNNTQIGINNDICSGHATYDDQSKTNPNTKASSYNNNQNHTVHILLQIWDIGGQSISSKMLTKYLHNCDCVLLCYDITSSVSFENIGDWLSVVRKCNSSIAQSSNITASQSGAITANISKNTHSEHTTTTGNSTLASENDVFDRPLICLVGTKMDLLHLRAVKSTKHSLMCDKENLRGSYFVSSKTGEGIEMMFKQIAADLTNINLTSAQEASFQQPQIAEIINHVRHDESYPEPAEPGSGKDLHAGSSQGHNIGPFGAGPLGSRGIVNMARGSGTGRSSDSKKNCNMM